MAENHLAVHEGFRILRDSLAPYIARELTNKFGDQWWRYGVLDVLTPVQQQDLPVDGHWAQRVDSLDVACCLRLLNEHWNSIFRDRLPRDCRTWGFELIGTRNRLAHLGGGDFSEDDTWRALDTMARLCEHIDSEATDEIRGKLRAFLRNIERETPVAPIQVRGSAPGSTTSDAPAAVVATLEKAPAVPATMPVADLPSWRDVILPHPDVSEGRYKNAEFAADLAQVARGTAASEYQDPVEFFERTYVTEGMAALLEQALRRVSGGDGDPVIQLKTAFGGGKTHSMLALYHLLNGGAPLDKLPSVQPIADRAGVSTLPKINVAVLVGTDLNPTKSKRPAGIPGISARTLWGDMAAQLAIDATDDLDERRRLYNFVRDADSKGVSPGSEALKNLFDAAGPCLVLMDELVAYARKLYDRKDLVAGTFDNFLTFVQEVTEAANASKNSLVVASIPESDLEIGGEAGRQALRAIEHTFGRMESIWQPVAANEGFEVVRRRLFGSCRNPKAREEVCAHFSEMYRENRNDFPIECCEKDYRDRMVSCYPIHPEVFDRLYEDWATLEGFQRTRGVLRLMAAVIHDLWMKNDPSPMIMPGSIPMDDLGVRNELTRHLPPGWNAIVDSEIDGKSSTPYHNDQANARYGSKLASRRVARAIMLGSAPSSSAQKVRGIEKSHIRLGVVQPGENISIFNDALTTLGTSLSYLYSDQSGDRYWYDTQPTLRKTAEGRALHIPRLEVEDEIKRRLKLLAKPRGAFAGVHTCPDSPASVPDDREARLVILNPADTYDLPAADCAAMKAATDILTNLGKSPRTSRNMLVFLAPDERLMPSLVTTVQRYLAWESIRRDSVALNLDQVQTKETKEAIAKLNDAVDDQIREAYAHLLTPYIDPQMDPGTMQWEHSRLAGSDGIVERAEKKLRQDETIITKWAPAPLKMDLDSLLWTDADHIQISRLWEQLATYCYLPRLKDESVLMDAIKAGLQSKEYFAYAAGWDGTRYLDLSLGKLPHDVDRSGLLVKVSVAQRQLEEDAQKPPVPPGPPQPPSVKPGFRTDPSTNVPAPPEPPKPVEPQNTHFYLSTPLDAARIGPQMLQLMNEVMSHLQATDGAKVDISLEVQVDAPQGFSQQTERTVSENCRTLHVDDFGFGK